MVNQSETVDNRSVQMITTDTVLCAYYSNYYIFCI